MQFSVISSSIRGFERICTFWVRCALGLVLCAAGHAKTLPPTEAAAAVRVQNALIISQKLSGKVVVFYHWHTGCMTCLAYMNELRNNSQGWQDKPFKIVAINWDSNRSDFDNYVAYAKQMVEKSAQISLVHYSDLAAKANPLSRFSLPYTEVVDMQGVVRHKVMGKVSAEQWDEWAELLP